MVPRFTYTLLAALSIIQFTFAQQATHWINPIKSAQGLIGGRGWPADSIPGYGRLPKHAERNVSAAVWHLGKQSAGVTVNFRTKAESVRVRYQVSQPLELPHMPATGVSGVDLYALDVNGDWHRAKGTYQFGDTIQFTYTALNKPVGAYRLYLPLYNEVKWLEVGIPDSTTLDPLPNLTQRPIVVYGTSIVQGACASRPGLAWTSLLERQMDRPVINLGFSGNGLLEPDFIEELIAVDAAVYVLDCIPNIYQLPDTEQKKRIKDAVHRMRQAHPETPIVLVEDASSDQQFMNDFDGGAHARSNEILIATVNELATEGVWGLHVLCADEIGFNDAATVDGIHPGDLGMVRYADAYERILREILHEPVGTVSTTRPKRQYREFPFYDWSERYRTLLDLNTESPSKHVILGNSIVHYWAGEPNNNRPTRGPKSWAKFMAPHHVRNMGFGWDRIENVLWRVYQGALDGFQANDVILMIGTNNLQFNTDEEITTGLTHLVSAIKQRQPTARVTLCGLLPRKDMESRVATLNPSIADVAQREKVDYLELSGGFLLPSGLIDASLFVDGLHPNEAGYQKIAEKIAPILHF